MKNADIAGFGFDKCTVGSGMVSEGVSRRGMNINSEQDSREFKFYISGLNAQVLIELDYIGSPADYLFYKGELLPLYTPLRIQMQQKLEKLVCSE